LRSRQFCSYSRTSRILWNAKVHYRVHKSPPLIPILSHISLVHTTPSFLSEIHFNIVTWMTRAFLCNGSVNAVNVQNGRCVSMDECYCAFLGNSAPMKTLARNHVTCSLCVGFLCVVRGGTIQRGLQNNTSSSVQFSSVQQS
jgi:hypothetical protein